MFRLHGFGLTVRGRAHAGGDGAVTAGVPLLASLLVEDEELAAVVEETEGDLRSRSRTASAAGSPPGSPCPARASPRASSCPVPPLTTAASAAIALSCALCDDTSHSTRRRDVSYSFLSQRRVAAGKPVNAPKRCAL